MNTKIRKYTTFVAVLSVCLFLLGQTVSGQNKCLNVHGKLISVSSGGPQTSGTISQGGILNGTDAGMFTGGGTTPDPATASYTRISTITTVQGELRTDITGLFNPGAGLITEIARVNPTTSTGRFAGASGVLFLSGTFNFPTATATLDISGKICFADE